MSSSTKYQDWWESVWQEREDLLKSIFGETSPPGTVVSFEWDDIDLVIPGACAFVFPRALPRRPEWLTISHGLTQPLEPTKANSVDVPSGYGYEFAFLTDSRESWCPNALWQLMTYLRQSGTFIDRGHRVPMWFYRSDDAGVASTLGKVPSDREALALGEMRAAMFWPYLAYPSGFSTSTGYFSVLVGTLISLAEWEWAKATSTAHLLLLLFECGIRQVSILKRACLTLNRKWQLRWEELRQLPEDVVNEMLLLSPFAK